MQLHRAREEFAAAGVGLMLIGQATPHHAAHFCRRLGIELPILADEQRTSYTAVGARGAGIGGLLSPKIVAKGVAASARNGVHQGRTIGSLTQLGAAMVIAPGGEVLLRHISKDAGDNVSPHELLAAISAAPSR